jgi:hypothetical protein
VVGGQVVEGSLKTGRELLPVNGLERLGPIDPAEKGGVGLVGGIEPRAAVVMLARLAPAGLSHEVNREVRNDPVKPRKETRVALEPFEPTVDPEERFLNEVAGILLVAHHADGDGEGAPLMALDQLTKSRLVALLSRLDERTILLRFDTPGL